MARKNLKRKTITLPNGQRKDFYGKTEEELNQKLFDAQMALRAGVDLSCTMRVDEYAQIWLNNKRLTVRPQTANVYADLLNNYILPQIGGMTVPSVKASHIRAISASMSKYSLGLAKNVLWVMRDIFNHALDDNMIIKSPVPVTLKATGKPPKVREALADEDVRRLIESVEDADAKLFLIVAFNTGLRRGEILALMWNSIDLKQDVIQVERDWIPARGGSDGRIEEYGKTKAAIRTVPIPKCLHAALVEAKRRNKNSLYVFHTKSGQFLPLSCFEVMWEHVRKAADELGIYLSPHYCRHTYTTKMIETGLDVTDVQRLVGHSNPTITMKVYNHYRREQREETAFEAVRKALG